MSDPVCRAVEALGKISQALPQIPVGKPVSCLADFREATALAAYFGQSGEKVPQASASINRDILEVENLLGEGRRVARRLHGELMGVAQDLWQNLSTCAPQLLHPEPGVRGTAGRQINQAAAVGAARVRTLTRQAEAELMPAAARLEEIASRQCESVTGQEVPLSQANTQPTSYSADSAVADRTAANVSPFNAQGASSEELGERAVAHARSQIGTPYKWGGTSPSGFDCSGLTQWSYQQVGVEIPRTAESQTVGRKVSAEELQPGDLVVWDGHVAMYSGNGMMIEAGDPVQENPLRTNNMGMTFLGFYRPTG